MKYTLLLLLLFPFIHSFASNDTLTRAQVYNFNVGDTFDYETDYINLLYEQYQRVVITGTWHSQNADTLFIEEKTTVYRASEYVDTIVIGGIGQYEALIPADTCEPTITTNSISRFNNRPVNVRIISCPAVMSTDSFVSGLGSVHSNINEYIPDEFGGFWNERIQRLIYYSKNGERWGTPYTVTDISEISQQKFIAVYPTLNTGNFTIVTEDDAGKMQFQLYDILGRSVYSQIIYGGKTKVCMTDARPGIYLWSVNGENIFHSGKIIVE